MNAETLLGHLTHRPAPDWICDIALQVYPRRRGNLAYYETTEAVYYPEVTVRVPTQKRAKCSGKRYRSLQRRRIDVVALIKANYRRWSPIVVGVEIKVSKHDLLNDHKMMFYLPYCHQFYLAVPDSLLAEAHQKISTTTSLTPSGILSVAESGHVSIHRPSNITTPLDRELSELYAELLIRQFRKDTV